MKTQIFVLTGPTQRCDLTASTSPITISSKERFKTFSIECKKNDYSFNIETIFSCV